MIRFTEPVCMRWVPWFYMGVGGVGVIVLDVAESYKELQDRILILCRIGSTGSSSNQSVKTLTHLECPGAESKK